MKRRVLTSIIPTPNLKVVLSQPEAHHIRHVLKMKSGDEVLALNGLGQSAYTKLIFEKKDIFLEYTYPGPTAHPNFTEFTVELGILKGEKMNWIIGKLTELGVCRLVPLITACTAVTLRKKNFPELQMRWQKIANQALKHSERLYQMKIETPQFFKNYFQFTDPMAIKIVCDEQERKNAPFIMNWLLNFSSYPKKWNLLIGPEGGWNFLEREQIEKKNYEKISLGKSVLKAETAILFSVSLITAFIQKKTYETKAF